MIKIWWGHHASTQQLKLITHSLIRSLKTWIVWQQSSLGFHFKIHSWFYSSKSHHIEVGKLSKCMKPLFRKIHFDWDFETQGSWTLETLNLGFTNNILVLNMVRFHDLTLALKLCETSTWRTKPYLPNWFNLLLPNPLLKPYSIVIAILVWWKFLIHVFKKIGATFYYRFFKAVSYSTQFMKTLSKTVEHKDNE